MRFALAAAVATQSMIFGLAVNLSPPEGITRTALHAALALSAAIVFALVGLPLTREAIAAARQRRIVVEQLFLVGIIGAFGASLVASVTGTGHVYYEVVAVLLAIFTLGRILRQGRRRQALEAARALGAEFEWCERCEADGSRTRVRVSELSAGDIVQVAAGEPIPVDGEIVAGTALLDEATLTGEPFPVPRRSGDAVLAGSRSLDGALRIRAAGPARLLDRLLARVQEAQSRPSGLERSADRLVAWFLPTVLILAGITFVGWTWHAGWTVGLFNALAVLVVACPCAMGLATPLGVCSALADLARQGVIASSPDLVERLAAVRQVVFDKTGTLGERDLELAAWTCSPGIAPDELFASLAALEAASQHPIAGAFRRFPFEAPATAVRVLPGRGLEGRVGGRLWRLTRSENTPGHVLAVTRDEIPAGSIELRERLRDSTPAVLAALDELGLRCTVLTGDRHAAGLPAAETNLTPLAKARRVRELSARAPVLFVGDGVNDAAAMSEAHAALSVAGSNALAREASMGEVLDLRAIAPALERSRAALQAIRHNLLFAAAYNAIGITLAAAGALHPIAAALLMLASSVTVSWRALRPASAAAPRRDPSPGRLYPPVPAVIQFR